LKISLQFEMRLEPVGFEQQAQALTVDNSSLNSGNTTE
jgi:hypothetical protein